MSTRPRISIHWFRRDLRLEDNHGLWKALSDHGDVLPLFIFDTDILGKSEDRGDGRVTFIHRAVAGLKEAFERRGGSMLVEFGRPLDVWKGLLERYAVSDVTVAHDHEPYAIARDLEVAGLLRSAGVRFRSFKDISIFERDEVLKEDGTPYTVFTPYARKWRSMFRPAMADPYPSAERASGLWKTPPMPMPDLESIGFTDAGIEVPSSVPDLSVIRDYHLTRDLPGVVGTSRMGVHLRFGTVSVRSLVRAGWELNDTYLNELIWREFFMQIMWHFPHVVTRAFKPAYDNIPWRQDEAGFAAWCEGRTGYPLVDAGMRELEATGYMHNRVRMVVASFLTKHLLIDRRWGESWFARKLLDFELSSNNGGWQWACGSGCDAAPYFRVFNPALQLQKFDPRLTYVKQWVPEYPGMNYAAPIVVHDMARKRAIEVYKTALNDVRDRTTKQNELFN